MDHAVVDYRGAGADDGLRTGGGLTHSFRFFFFFMFFPLSFFLLSIVFLYWGGWDGEGEMERDRDGRETLGELWSAFWGSLFWREAGR